MKFFPRTVSRTILALAAAFVLGGGGAGAATFEPGRPSVSGAYLAGTQALFSLRTDDAARYFRDALSVDWDNSLLVERAFIAFAANGEIAEASATAKRLLETQPEHDLARLVIATEAMRSEDYDTAISMLESVGAESFAGITGAILRAWALIGDGRADEAEALLNELGQNGLEEFLVFHRALMADVTGDTETALGYAKEAYETDQLVARIVEAYTRMLGNAGRFDEAAAVLDHFEREGFAHPLVAVVQSAINEKRRPGSFAANAQAGAAEMFHGVGVALARDGSSDIALVFLQLGLYLDPSADVIALILGQLLDSAGQHDAANAVYNGVAATSPLKGMAVVRVAENLDATGNRDEALRRLGNIVRANPDDLDALSVLGDLQRTAERYAEAADSYTRALAITGGDRPGDWRFYYVRGIAHERNKEWEKAEADFQKALELRPDQPQVLNYLGYSWVDQGMHLVEALDMIEKAVEASPNDGYIVDSLGWAFYRLGRYDEAVEALERAVQLRPGDPEINDHLGDAYWRANRRLEARFQWSIASDVDDEGNVRERAAPKLANGLDVIPTAEEQVPVQTASEEPEAAPDDMAAVDPAAVETPAEPAPAEDVEDVEDVATAPEEPAPVEPRTIVVQPGDNLWNIAAETYGKGTLYRLIVEANADKVPRPSLIQPGLELVLPPAP